MLKLLPPAYLLAALAFAVLASFLFPLPVLIPPAARIAGLLPVVAGIALNLAADRQFKRRATTVKPFQRSSALITDGVFRWSRNPMYLGMVMIVAVGGHSNRLDRGCGIGNHFGPGLHSP
jgi:protein-S-isoprenylcysteine O-methyltransferase Ste14